MLFLGLLPPVSNLFIYLFDLYPAYLDYQTTLGGLRWASFEFSVLTSGEMCNGGLLEALQKCVYIALHIPKLTQGIQKVFTDFLLCLSSLGVTQVPPFLNNINIWPLLDLVFVLAFS